MNAELKALIDLASLANPELLNKEVFRRLLYLQLLPTIDMKGHIYTQMTSLHSIIDEVIHKLY